MKLAVVPAVVCWVVPRMALTKWGGLAFGVAGVSVTVDAGAGGWGGAGPLLAEQIGSDLFACRNCAFKAARRQGVHRRGRSARRIAPRRFPLRQAERAAIAKSIEANNANRMPNPIRNVAGPSPVMPVANQKTLSIKQSVPRMATLQL